jgi:hypothetical protein
VSYIDLIERYANLSEEEKARLLLQYNIRPISGGDGTGEDDEDDDEGEDDDESDDDEADSGKTRKSSQKPKTYTQNDVERLVKQRLARARSKMESDLTDSITKKVQNQIEVDAAAKKGDLQKVIDDLRPKAEKLERIEKELGLFHELSSTRFEEVIENLPEDLKMLAPDDDASPVQKERWLITKAMPALKKWQEKEAKKKTSRRDEDEEDEDEDEEEDTTSRRSTRRQKVTGNNPFTPLPGGKNDKKTLEEIVKGYEESGAYRPM